MEVAQVIKEIVSGIALGVYHSVIGCYTWCFYDDQPRRGVSSISSTQGAQPLTTLAARRRYTNAKDTSTAASDLAVVPAKKPIDYDSVFATIMFTYKNSFYLAFFHLNAAVVLCLVENSVHKDYVHIACYSFFFLKLSLAASKFVFITLFNMLMQSEVARTSYAKVLGRTMQYANFAECGSELYTALQLQLIYKALVSWQQWILCIYFPLGYAIAVPMKTAYWTLYVFDYCWHFKAYNYKEKCAFIQQNWPYTLGFGLILSSIEIMLHPFYSEILPMFLLPMLIVSSMEAWKRADSCSSMRFKRFAVPFFAWSWYVSEYIHTTVLKYAAKSYVMLIDWYYPAELSDDESSASCTPRDTSHSSVSRRSLSPTKRKLLVAFSRKYPKRSSNSPSFADDIEKRIKQHTMATARHAGVSCGSSGNVRQRRLDSSFQSRDSGIVGSYGDSYRSPSSGASATTRRHSTSAVNSSSIDRVAQWVQDLQPCAEVDKSFRDAKSTSSTMSGIRHTPSNLPQTPSGRNFASNIRNIQPSVTRTPSGRNISNATFTSSGSMSNIRNISNIMCTPTGKSFASGSQNTSFNVRNTTTSILNPLSNASSSIRYANTMNAALQSPLGATSASTLPGLRRTSTRYAS